jgi:hypothetical protein
MRAPFFVLGPGRSGTSLLAAQLNSHPQLKCGMEDGAMRAFSEAPKGFWKSDVAKNRYKDFGNHCGKMARKNAQIWWGNKVTTEQMLLYPDLLPEEAAQLFKEVFPDAKVIFVYRDGRTCVPSKMKRGGHSLEKAISNWKQGLEVGTCLEKYFQDDVLFISYESLIIDSEKTLIAICAFLKIPYHSTMLDATNSDLLPKMYQHGALIADKVNPKSEENWHRLLEPEQSRWGY